MQVLNRVGHAVQEDDPEKVASILANFLVRNKFTNPTQDFVRYVKNFLLIKISWIFGLTSMHVAIELIVLPFLDSCRTKIMRNKKKLFYYLGLPDFKN